MMAEVAADIVVGVEVAPNPAAAVVVDEDRQHAPRTGPLRLVEAHRERPGRPRRLVRADGFHRQSAGRRRPPSPPSTPCARLPASSSRPASRRSGRARRGSPQARGRASWSLPSRTPGGWRPSGAGGGAQRLAASEIGRHLVRKAAEPGLPVAARHPRRRRVDEEAVEARVHVSLRPAGARSRASPRTARRPRAGCWRGRCAPSSWRRSWPRRCRSRGSRSGRRRPRNGRSAPAGSAGYSAWRARRPPRPHRR